MKGYEFFEHTADIGVKAYGKTLAEAFENAAKAMMSIITDDSEVEFIGQYDIEIEADSIEQLLFNWLSELLFLHSANNLVFGFFKVELDDKGNRLKAHVCGESFNHSKHRMGTEIKAVTYHMLEVKMKPPYEVKVLFDI
ncbi:MAG: archease [Candidatus Thermoplasmatota archaeon]